MQNTVKHTPGPWCVWNFNDDPRHVAVGPEAGGLAVADIVACNAHGCYTAATEAQGAANARLIASAPDLLAALIDSRNVLSMALPKFGEDSTDNEDSAEDVRGLINRIDDAIAKARGEA